MNEKPENLNEILATLELRNAEKAGGSFSNYVTACIASICAMPQEVGINGKEIRTNPKIMEKLASYNDVSNNTDGVYDRKAFSYIMDAISELEADIIEQSEALGKPISDYSRPEMPPHIKVMLNSPTMTIINAKRPFRDSDRSGNAVNANLLREVPTSVAPEKTGVEKTERKIGD